MPLAVFRIADHVRSDDADRLWWTMVQSGPRGWEISWSVCRQTVLGLVGRPTVSIEDFQKLHCLLLEFSNSWWSLGRHGLSPARPKSGMSGPKGSPKRQSVGRRSGPSDGRVIRNTGCKGKQRNEFEKGTTYLGTEGVEREKEGRTGGVDRRRNTPD